MFKISIDKNIKLDEVDLLYTQLNSHVKSNLRVDLLLPVELKNSYVGIVPLLYQFVFTWMRYGNSGKLLLDIASTETTNLEGLYENELIFPMVSLVWNKNEIFDKTGSINLRTYLRDYNVRFFDKMKAVEAQKGEKLILTNFDHLPEDRGILPCFEINGIFSANETKLSNSLKGGIQRVLSYSKDAQNSYEEIKVHLMGIIYELMKNTFEWGNKDENNVPLDPSLRGLLVKFYKKTRVKLLEEFKSHKGLSSYFGSQVLKENIKSEIYFLEIDVFDSGVGFVRKYKAINPNEDLSDVDIIKKCLIKHNTSAKGLEKDDKGIGLDRILAILDGKGFLRIKTGSNCVYRNLISNRYKNVGKDNVGEMELFDWKSNSNEVYTNYPQAEGCIITIIYPLSFYLKDE
jgi:hypothetical protein